MQNLFHRKYNLIILKISTHLHVFNISSLYPSYKCICSCTCISLPIESLAKCGVIYYTVRPFVAMLPAWWRFAQCVRRYGSTREAFPHLVNAGKYSTAFFVVTFSTVAAALKGERKREREREGERERERCFSLTACTSFSSTM